MTYEEKKKNLLKEIDKISQNDVALAFSGGVDSALLLKLFSEAMKKSEKKIYAVTFNTKLNPVNDLETAKKVAKEMDVEHVIIQIDELKESGIENNPIDRCYLCKKSLFKKLKDYASDMCIEQIVEGTNGDDLGVYRPGIKAIKELKIKSPLADVGFTKEEVRRLAKELGVSVSNRPSTPCMATRFPYFTKLDYDKIKKVEFAEKYLRDIGFCNVRIRVHDNIARIEIDKKDMILMLDKKDEVVENLKKFGYDYITLDLEGFRSGSMDIHIKNK